MAKAVGFLLFLATVVNLSHSQTADFTITPAETAVGTIGKLQCMTKSKLHIQTWIVKKGADILIQYDKSFKFIHPSVINRAVIDVMKFDQNILVVEISPVRCKDHGNYTCIIKQDTNTLKSSSVTWTVKDSPRDIAMSANFIDLNTPDEIEIVAGKPIHLLCQAQLGNPVGVLEWFVAKVGMDEDIKEINYEKTSDNVTMSDTEAVINSCQHSLKSSIKLYPSSPMKLGIKCQVENALNTTSTERIFKIIKKVETEKVSSTLIIIIVLAVIIPEIIIAIILGIVLYIRRKRQKKKRELEAAEAEEKAAMPDRQSRNSFQMKARSSSKGGRRKRDSSLKEKADAPEKQAMTGYRDDPEA